MMLGSGSPIRTPPCPVAQKRRGGGKGLQAEVHTVVARPAPRPRNA